MITVYAANTPNGVKVPIALEELGLVYELRRVDLHAGEQHSAAFHALNPNERIPVLVDTDGPLGDEAMFESGAILWYLAERYGGLVPGDPAGRLRTLVWLTLQVAGVGPMFGQAGWFLRAAPSRIEPAIERYRSEAQRLTGILDERLARHEWLAGEVFTIADIAHFGYLRIRGYAGFELDEFPHVRRWLHALTQRASVGRALARLAPQ